ncbi:Uncharacterized protein HZ326_6181 [Fusarium oxysporum f. sp. albedinis]|nr:Uncharacterized protein HZ326_6181 [Fusarium oxysporum f. sp. albedinis]
MWFLLFSEQLAWWSEDMVINEDDGSRSKVKRYEGGGCQVAPCTFWMRAQKLAGQSWLPGILSENYLIKEMDNDRVAASISLMER